MKAQESIGGIWNMGQENTKIEIKENKGVYEGRLKSSDNENAKIGNLILKEIKLVGKEWKGKLYSPRKGKWFDATLKLSGNTLLVTVNGGWKSKTVEWTKD